MLRPIVEIDPWPIEATQTVLVKFVLKVSISIGETEVFFSFSAWF